MKISCVMTTYRRFTCVERSIQFFLNQKTSVDTELIIYNTDVEYPLILGDSLSDKNITIINNNTDLQTKNEYTNIGAIRRDAIEYASGDYYICWDDDDIFLPWNIQQCVDGINRNPDKWAWKPAKSMWWQTNHPPEFAENVMEASILSRLDKIREIGFKLHQGGGEHLQWIDYLNHNKLIVVDKHSIPAYCFNWHDAGQMRGHKQSGSIDRLDNFQFHKSNTHDKAIGKLEIYPNNIINDIYQQHIDVIKKQIGVVWNNGYVVEESLVDRYIV